jgi:hypothetical protein
MPGEFLRCAHCPVESGLPCKGLQVRRLCELSNPDHADFNPSYRSLLVQLARTDASRAQPERSGESPDLAESLRLIGQLRSCPHRTARADCGCAGVASCALGRGRDGLVNHHDCFNCLRACKASE